MTYLIKYAIIISEKGGETMANTTMNPSTARKNFYQLLKEVNENHTEIEIISDRSGNNAVLIGLEDWRAIQETLFLEQTGTLDKVRDREKDDSGFTNIDDIDWEAL
ncbi:prevent-host-death family protein [Enterococcus faecium]|nr:prevent-host-death family protein [Enterococcus faecium]MBK4788491.1 prevent-host-death family protein [Enterococcus faecium]MBK4844471.1 prevent-host-death family protein [Enterococcus faecium]MBK4875717.1 prevent-host-death family protein [Enterococcus faecium]